MVLGVPVTNLIAAASSFMTAMLFFAAVNAAAFLLTVFFVPSMPATETISYGKQIGVLKRPSMRWSILIVIFLNGAIFGFFSYISDFMGTVKTGCRSYQRVFDDLWISQYRRKYDCRKDLDS